MARDPLSFGEDDLEEVRQRQEDLYQSDPLLGPDSGLLFSDADEIAPVDNLSFAPEDTAEVPIPDDLSEAGFADAGAPYAGTNGATPDRAPDPNEDSGLPFGEYDPSDIRVQYLQRIGRNDGNFASMVLERFSSGDEDPTPQEVFNAADQAAKAVAGELGISTRSNEGKMQIAEMTEAFSRMYKEQHAIMGERGMLTAGETATDGDAPTEVRIKAGLEQIGTGNELTYETYRRRLENRGKFDPEMSEAQQDALIADEIIRDLKAVKVPATDLILLQNRLDAGDWSGLRGERAGPPMPSASQLRESQAQAEADAAGPGLLERLFSSTDDVAATEEEAAATPAAPPAPPTFGQAAPAPEAGDPLTGDRPENPYAAITRQAREDQALSNALGVASTAALDAVRAPDQPLTEQLIDAATRFTRGATSVVASAPTAGAILAPELEEANIRAMGGGGMTVPEREARIEEIRQILISGIDPDRQEAVERLGLPADQAAELVQLTDAGRDVLSQEQQTLAQSIRDSRAVGTAEDRRGLDLASDIRNWQTDTFGVPTPENDDAIWAQVSEGLGSSVAFLSVSTGPTGIFRGAALGATASAAGAYEQALARGATEEEATEAAGLMALVGMTEVIPLTRMLDRLPQNLRGGVRQRVSKYLGDVVKEGGEEALQEGFQQIMDNIVSQGVYDFEVDTWEGVGESATVGGITGLILPGVIGVPGLVRGEPGAAPDADPDVAPDVIVDTPDAPEVLEDAPLPEADEPATERDADAAPVDTSAVDDILSQIMSPLDRASTTPEAQLQSDLPARVEQVPTQDILRAVSESDTRREDIREAALPETDIPAEAMTRVEAEAGAVVPSPEEVELAATTSSEILALQAQVDEGTRTLTPNDRQALAVLTNGADEILAVADRVVIEAREALTAALGADIDTPIRVTAPVTSSVNEVAARPAGEARRRSLRNAITRRQRDEASDALTKLRHFSEGRVPEASIIGAMAGLPSGLVATLETTGATPTSTTDPIGAHTFRNELAMPSSASSAAQQAEALTSVLEAMNRHQTMLQNLAISSAVNPDGSVNTDLTRRISEGRVAEAEPLRQALQARVFRGRDSGLINEISLASLATATDEQLRRWGTARGPDDIQDLDTALGVRNQILPGRTRRPSETRRDADLELIRKSARLVENVRAAERKTVRARDAVTRALDVLSAITPIDQSGTDIAGFIQGVRSAAAGGATDAVALRESLRRNAPNLANDAEARPLRDLAAQIGMVNSNLPVDLQVSRDALARAYQSTLTNDQLFGENWRSRRLVRTLDQEQLVKTVDQIMALTPASDSMEIQSAREELAAMAVAEQLLLQNRLPALREQLATARAEGQPYAHLIGEISTTRVMDPDELGEMLVNEFGLDEDTAAGVVFRGQEISDAALGEPEAIKAVNEGAEDLIVSVHFSRGEWRSGLEGIDPNGDNINYLPTEAAFSPRNPEAAIEEIQSAGLRAPGVRTLPSMDMDRVGAMLSTMARNIGLSRGVTFMPLMNYGSMREPIMTLFPVAERATVGRALDMAAEDAQDGTGTLGMAVGTQFGDIIFVDPALPPGEMAAVAAHELGHVAMVDMITTAKDRSPHTLNMLYRAYRESPYADTYRRSGAWPVDLASADVEVDGEQQIYINSFNEWFASQVGKHIAQGPTQPKGLVGRLVERVAVMWRKIRAALTGDNEQLTRTAVSQLIEEHVRAGLPTQTWGETDVLIGSNDPEWLARVELPAGRDAAPHVVGRQQFSVSRSQSPSQLTPEDQQVVLTNYAGLTSGQGVRVRFINPARMTVRERQALRDNPTGYLPMTNPSYPAQILVNPSKIFSREHAIKEIDRAIVVQHGLDGLIGRAGTDRLKQALLDPKNSPIGRTSNAVSRKLQALKRSVVRDLTVNGTRPAEADVADTMLARLAEEALTGDYAEAAATSAPILRRALQLGDRMALDDTHLMGLLVQARNPQNYRQAKVREPAVSKRMQDDVSRILERGLTAVRERNLRSAPSRYVFRESTFQAAYRAYFDYALPLIRLQRLGQATARDEGASEETRSIGENMALWGRNVVDRLRGYNNQLKRVLDAQHEVHASMDEEFGSLAGELGYRDVAVVRRDINLMMSARASIERNENTALVYGRLDDSSLEQQRAQILADADAAVEAIQGDNRGRTAASFDEVRQIRRDQMGQLRTLLLGPNTPDSTVKRYISESRRGITQRNAEEWMDVSGISSGGAIEIIRQIDEAHGGRFVNTFMSSGLDGRLRRLLDQTYENRVMSGIYGASGELLISRLGMEHHSPLRGLEIGVGKIVRDDAYEQPQYDVGFLATGLRTPGTRLAPAEQLRHFRNTAAVTDVLDTGMQEYMSSIREMTTNHINGALVGLSRAMDAMGIAEGTEGDRRPITVSEEIPYLIPSETNPSVRVRNPLIERARNTINEDGETGSILHALPNGNYMIIQINDPTIYTAMTYRFNTGPVRAGARLLAQGFGELTRITARTFTSWDPLYTTFRAVTRDIQEGAVMAFFEQGVPARRTATLPFRAIRLMPALEKFFQANETRRAELLAEAIRSPSHPMNSFARRWNAGEVQTFAQQLELITDRSRIAQLAPGLQEDTTVPGAASTALATAAEFVQNNVITRRLEAHADAMENAVRQAAIDILETTYLEEGSTPPEAQRRAYEQGISLLDFAQRSDVGETLAPVFPFAQSAITGASAMIERRIWRGGEPPVSATSTYVDDNGKVVYSVDWNQVLGALNIPMMSSLVVGGFLNVMLMGATAGIAWNLLGGDDEDDEDELDEATRSDIAKIRSKYIGPTEDGEAQNWLMRNLNAAARKWVHRDAELDNLDDLKISSIMSGWVMPWQTDERQGAAPISYGVVSQFVNLGQAAALIALGKDPSRVTASYTNSTIRNMTPLDAPYNDTPQGIAEFMAMAFPPTLSHIYEVVKGETLDGILLRNESPFDLGPNAYGPANTPRFSQSLQFNEMIFDLGVTMQEAGHDMGIPWAGETLRRFLPDGARMENLLGEVPVFGQHIVSALQETERAMMKNAGEGEQLYDIGDAAEFLGDRILVGSGFAKRDPQKAARTAYYEQLRWRGWDALATYDRDTLRGIEYENSDYNDIRKAVGQIQGLMQKREGEAKKDQLRIYSEKYQTATTYEERAEAMREMGEIEDNIDALFRASADTLDKMREHVNTTAPRIIQD